MNLNELDGKRSKPVEDHMNLNQSDGNSRFQLEKNEIEIEY